MPLVLERPDLDGLRLQAPGSPEVWLMFHGVRHRIPSSAVYDALFSEISGLVAYSELDSVAEGAPLSEGACLIRAEGTVFIHLLTTSAEGDLRRHFIPTYESLLDFGFDSDRVRDLPGLVVEALPAGRDLTSAADRAARR